VERILSVFVTLRQRSGEGGAPGCPLVNAAAERADPSHPGCRLALEYKLRLQAFFARQADAAGATAPEQLAEQLVMLFDGANAFALVRGTTPPGSLLTAARSLVEAQIGAEATRT
jgi:hypothetical protein